MKGIPCTAIRAVEKLAADAILDIECDIWIPAARPDVVKEDNAGRLKAKLNANRAPIFPAPPTQSARCTGAAFLSCPISSPTLAALFAEPWNIVELPAMRRSNMLRSASGPIRGLQPQ